MGVPLLMRVDASFEATRFGNGFAWYGFSMFGQSLAIRDTLGNLVPDAPVIVATPEPSTFALTAIGAAGLLFCKRSTKPKYKN